MDVKLTQEAEMTDSPWQLPQYRSHRVVQAAKIEEIRALETPHQYELVFADGQGKAKVTGEWISNRGAEEGGYYVLYEDGYESWSPAEAFEEGYTPLSESPESYRLTDEVREELVTRFTYHAPKGDQTERYSEIRQMASDFARRVLRMTPQSREQSLFLTHVETAVMWANAAIARRE